MKRNRTRRLSLWGFGVIAVTVLFAVSTVLLTQFFNVNYIKVSGNSMQPTFNTSDGVFVSTTDESPQRDDVTVFVTPPEWMEYLGDSLSEPTFFVKRAVGIPGDTATFSSSGVEINGDPLFTNDASRVQCDRGPETYTLTEDEYLLLGDNHSFSTDAYRLYCAGADLETVIVGSEYIEFFGESFWVIDGGWEWFEKFSGTGGKTTGTVVE